MFYFKFFILIVSVISLINGCSRQIPTPENLPNAKEVSAFSSDAMVLVDESFQYHLKGDDLTSRSLKQALLYSMDYLKKINPDTQFRYGKLTYTAEEIVKSHQLFIQLISQKRQYLDLIKTLEAGYYLFQSSANHGSQVMFTGYYEPIFPGSLQQSEEYNVPVYSLPENLIVLDLGRFRDSLLNRTIVYRMENEEVRPYFTRQQIMEQGVLSGKNLEIAWMRDPVDLFFMQVQGSGILQLENGSKLRLSYNGANGQPYSSIGKLLVDEGWMALEEVSMESIRAFIVNHPDLRERILYHNKSYTFFEIDEDVRGPKGNINVPLTQNRSIATDANIFPKGALAYIAADMPVYNGTWKDTSTEPFARFVAIQDTGGAIKGPGRVDLFWGNGTLAEKSAGRMRSFGKLYILVAKKETLNRIIE